MMSNRLAHATLDSITDDSLADGAGNGKAEARGQFDFDRSQAKSGKIAASHADTGLIDLAKFR